jgi:phage major head subunit gpT-like protein
MNLGQDLVLIVSPKNEALGRSILESDFVEGSATAKAVSNVNKGTARLVVWPQLAANEDAWFLLECGLPVKPLIVQFEKETTLTALTSDTSDHVFKKHEFLYQAYGRYNAGYGLPELAYGSDGTQNA